jgi:hypothetical protein
VQQSAGQRVQVTSLVDCKRNETTIPFAVVRFWTKRPQADRASGA